MRNRLFSCSIDSHMQLPFGCPLTSHMQNLNSSSYPQPAHAPGILHIAKDIICSRKVNIILDPPGFLTHKHSKSASHIDSASTRPAIYPFFSFLIAYFRHHYLVLHPFVLPSTNPFATLQPRWAFQN